MAHDRIVSTSGINTRKNEVDKFTEAIASFITTTDAPIKVIDQLMSKYEVSSGPSGEARGSGKSQSDIHDGLSQRGKIVKDKLDKLLEDYAKIESTSVRIISRVEELEALTTLTQSYYQLIRDNGTGSPDFASKCSKIRMEQASKIPAVMKQRVADIGEDVKAALLKQAPKLLTAQQIENIIRGKYGESMTPEQIKMLSQEIFKNCNTITISADGKSYKLSINEAGEYFINNVKAEKSSYEALFGKYKNISKTTLGEFNGKGSIGSFKNGKGSWGNKDFGTVSFGIDRGMELVMAKFIQDGVPLISSDDGRLQMIKNTQVEVLKAYGQVGGEFSSQGNKAGLKGSIKVGGDIIKIESDILTVPLFGQKDLTIRPEAGVGAKAEASLTVDKHKMKGKLGAGLGFTAGAEARVVDKDFRVETKEDVDF